jgi:phosphatidylserine/phosphatidylglycerophosphate/cardiolipin synthase-like enzyme
MTRSGSALVLLIACSPANADVISAKILRGNNNIDNCITNNYSSTEEAVPYDRNSSSYYLDFVQHRMRMLAPLSEGSVWGRSKGNRIAAPNASESWLLQSPNCWGATDPDKSCANKKAPGTLALANAIRDTISIAKHWVDITTLAISSATAATLADGIFHEKIVEGMKIALDHTPNVTFRFLAGSPTIGSFHLAAHYMSALEKDLGKEYFAMARIYITPQASEEYESWNHAKIVAADATRSVVGGHNLWDIPYYESAPVTDVSMTLSGPAVASAHRFADLLWEDVCDREQKRWVTGPAMARSPAAVEQGRQNPELVCPKRAIFDAPAAVGGVDVISLGQLGVSVTPPGGNKGAQLCGSNHGHKISGVSCVPNVPGGYVPATDYINDGGDYGSTYDIDNPQEEGIRALIASARNNITIAQQDFIWAGDGGTRSWTCVGTPHWAHYDLRLVDLLVNKMAVEHIPVSIIISTPGGKGGYTNMGEMSDFSNVLVSRVRGLGYAEDDATAKALLCRYLTLGSLRISPGFDKWADGNGNRLHAKVHMVDDEAFYVGSKNSYPATLQEFGYVVQDKVAASEFKQQFFEPILEYALTYTDPAKGICRL